jgi:uncharacterized membrane protein YbhN (UPF0104 family)
MPHLMKQKTSSLMVFGLKVAITLGLMAYLLGKVDIGPVVAKIRTMQPTWAAGAILLMFLQLALAGLRWQVVNSLVGAEMRVAQVFRLTLIGQFFNQVLPSALGGDAVRAWLASREGVPLARAVTGVLCDRAVGLIVLVLVISSTFLLWPRLVADRLPASYAFQSMALLGVGGLVALFFFGASIARLLMGYRVTEPAGKLVRDLRSVLYSGGSSVAIVALAAAIQALLVVIIYFCARGMNVPLNFAAALLVVPATMLVAMVPISFAGWGVREGAMIVGLGLMGIGANDALAISVAFGLLQIVVGLPGGVLWLVRSGAARAPLVRTEDGR